MNKWLRYALWNDSKSAMRIRISILEILWNGNQVWEDFLDAYLEDGIVAVKRNKQNIKLGEKVEEGGRESDL